MVYALNAISFTILLPQLLNISCLSRYDSWSLKEHVYFSHFGTLPAQSGQLQFNFALIHPVWFHMPYPLRDRLLLKENCVMRVGNRKQNMQACQPDVLLEELERIFLFLLVVINDIE